MTRDSVTATKANTRPSSAARSSSRITGSSGDLARRMNAQYDESPLILLVSMIAVRNEKDSSTIAMPSTTSGTHHQRLVRIESSGLPCASWISWYLWYAS